MFPVKDLSHLGHWYLGVFSRKQLNFKSNFSFSSNPSHCLKPGARGKHSRVIHKWAHVNLMTHMMPTQINAPHASCFQPCPHFYMIASIDSGLNTWATRTDPQT